MGHGMILLYDSACSPDSSRGTYLGSVAGGWEALEE